MITFDPLWKTMEKKGITTYRLRESCGIDSKTLDKLCRALDCSIEDIILYIKD